MAQFIKVGDRIIDVQFNMKYAGADWLSKQRSLSPLGTKVANVLGQVERGIYHIDKAVLSSRVDWEAEKEIKVNYCGPLASYDYNNLTLLVLCCGCAGLQVSVSGACNHYIRLSFRKETAPISMFFLDDEDWQSFPVSRAESYAIEDMSDFVRCFAKVAKQKPLYSHLRTICYSVYSLNWTELQVMLAWAHHLCYRVQLTGRSPSTLELQVTKRQREGGISIRHPTLIDQKKLFDSLINVDYGSLE